MFYTVCVCVCVCVSITEYHSAIKKEWNSAICNNVNCPREYYATEVSQTEKDRYCMLSLICGIKKKKPNKQMYIIKQKQTHRYREQTVGY